MSDRLLVSLSSGSVGSQLTLAEYTKDHKVSYSISYPITYTEACNVGEWATSRSLRLQCDVFLTATGWDIWLPIGTVINPDIPFHPLHSSSRRTPLSDHQKRCFSFAHYHHQYITE